MKVVVVAGSLFAATLAHAAPSSTVTPPVDWTVDTTGSEALAALNGKPGIRRTDLRQWNAPDMTATFKVVEIEATFENAEAREFIEGMEHGVKNSVGSARQLATNRREEPDTIVVDQVIEKEGHRIHFQRHYAVDSDDHLHNVTLSCISPAGSEDVAACAPTFASFQWTFKPVQLPKSTALAYKIGKLVGYFSIAAILVLLVLWVSRRKQRERTRIA